MMARAVPLLPAFAALVLIAVVAGRAPAQEGRSEPAQEGARSPAGQAPVSGGRSQPVDREAAARGGTLFNTIGCSGCHGTVGQGGIGPMTGPRVATRDDLPVEAFDYFLRHPAGAMPPYSEQVLSAAQVRDLYAYLAGSFTPAKVGAIPMLQAQR